MFIQYCTFIKIGGIFHPVRLFHTVLLFDTVEYILIFLQNMYSALALVMSKIKVGTTVKPIGSRPQFFIKTWSYMSGELRECSNFKNFFCKKLQKFRFSGPKWTLAVLKNKVGPTGKTVDFRPLVYF